MKARSATRGMIVGASVALLWCFGFTPTASSQNMPLASIIDAAEQAQAKSHPQISYRVLREYWLFSGNDSKATSDVVAEVNFRPPASRDYRIDKTSGSERGQQIVRRVLDHEVENRSKVDRIRTAMTRNNYAFTYLGEADLNGQTFYRLGLKPKRKDKGLIAGGVLIDEHTFLVRQIEGEVAQAPSWWLKTVHLKIEFADFNGTWLQTNMEAVADVRLVGVHTLTSRILDYQGAAEVATTKIPTSMARKP